MTGVREVFSEITERGIDVEVELGDDMVVRAVGRGTVAIQRESRPPLKFRCLLCPGAGEESYFGIDYRGQRIGGSLQRWPCVHPSEGCQLRIHEGDWYQDREAVQARLSVHGSISEQRGQ